MGELLKSDIFFFITTIAVVIFTILGTVALFYIIKIAKDAKEITIRVKSLTDLVKSDYEHLRVKVQEKERNWGQLLSLFWKKDSKKKSS